MARILCLDSEEVTTNALGKLGHEVETGETGYRNGRPLLLVPPHEVDIIIWDLKKPACFDTTDWGSHRSNDNFRCKIVDSPTDELMWTSDGSYRPRYAIIMKSQLSKSRPHSFGPSDLLKAVGIAGTPMLLFLNPEWLKHVGFSCPNVAGFAWTFKPTKATKVQITSPLIDTVPELASSVKLRLPLEFCIENEPIWSAPVPDFPIIVEPVVMNAVGQVFGQVIYCGGGIIYALPASEEDNLPLITTLLSRLEKLQSPKLPVYPIPEEVKQKRVQSQSVTRRDIFIAHASEDKEFAIPLAEALIGKGLTVWFDEYELKLGDSLRRKIEQGLRNSRYGVTILSHNFFNKEWPQKELDGLFALEKGEKKILPVWHNISIDEIEGYSPILADRVGISTEKGLEAVVKAILDAI